jgi:hypothetical protein
MAREFNPDDFSDLSVVELTVGSARKLIDEVDTGDSDEAETLTTAIDQAQGDARTTNDVRYVVIKISPDAAADADTAEATEA